MGKRLVLSHVFQASGRKILGHGPEAHAGSAQAGPAASPRHTSGRSVWSFFPCVVCGIFKVPLPFPHATSC